MCVDALEREESCGAHFREEYRTKTGEAQRDDSTWASILAWETNGWEDSPTFVRHVEPLSFEAVPLDVRDYR